MSRLDGAYVGWELETAIDLHVEPRADRERADADHLAALDANAPHGRNAFPGRRGRVGKDIDGGLRADEGKSHVVGLDGDRRPHIGHLERTGVLVVAHERIGGAQADGVEGAAHGNSEALVAGPPEILDGREQPRREDAQRRAHAAASTASSMGKTSRVPSAGLASRRSYSRSETGAKPTWSPGASRARGRGPRAHSSTGERPIRCQPHGVSSGNMQVIAPAIASDPAGIFSRGDSR